MDGGGSLWNFDRTQDWLDRFEVNKRGETQYVYLRETDGKWSASFGSDTA